ncbi:MAG: AAA family ATPase, partial [Firmicutes bacterium]|nr:AAA family ATPase [Bacillota bacterium]
MYLKRLELQGFKSFPEKIRLEFNKGITVVVGPNGSGKSNIADAVRWVLGEKSAKSLRGAKMEDIIFNGTANRKPMGFAEMSMVMDNTDRTLNLDFSEVTVTRRVYRSGESDYLINGSSCRLRDILELFMDTGVGKEGYSIIGQGRIDEILSTKSEDRRMLFEEAAGIVKYKSRRTEAANNLEKEHANLVRVNDIIAELETQVGPLEKQAEKTKKYLVLADRLKLVQVNIFVREADRFAKEISELTAQISQLNGNIAEEEDKKQLIQLENTQNKEKLVSVEADIEKTSADIAEKRSLKEQRQNDTNLYNTETEHIKNDIERVKSQISDADKQREEKKNKIALIQTEIKGKKLGLENKSKIYGEKQAEFEKFDLRVSESEEKVSSYNTGIIEKMNASNDLKSEKSKIQAVMQQQENRLETVAAELDGLDASYEEKQVSLKVLEKRYA